MILLSDGDNTAGNIDPITAAKLASAYDIKIYTIAIGKEGRVPFGTDFFGRTRYVENTLDETNLREIAKIGNGKFYRVSDKRALETVFDEIDQLEKAEIKEYVMELEAELKEAKACLDNTLVVVPELAKVHMLYGNLYRITGRIAEAEQAYATSERLDPNNPALYFNLGLMAQIRQDLEKAKGYYLRSLELYPNYGAALTNLGIIYGRQNALDKCIELLEKAVKLEPDLVDTYANLEQAYLLKGDKLKAEYYKQRGIEILRAQN